MSFRFASAAAIAACCSMAVAPATAAQLPRASAPSASVLDTGAVNAQNHRRWRRDRVDAGDVIGGLLVIGTIAAVASAASRASRNDRYRDRDYRYPDGDYRSDYRTPPYDSRWNDSRGLERAVDMCAAEVERNARIDTVDSANRTANGWDVSGRLRTGDTFRCTIGNDGRIEAIDYGRGAGYRGADRGDAQWDDERYAAARAAQEAAATPAYPGGPLPADDAEQDEGARYESAQAPGFLG